ncbi:MAG: response regulator [Candidatus Omnitrophota bacterium]
MDKHKILIIDDEINICKLLKLNLESTGQYSVDTVTSGEEGLDKVKAINYDLVITDYCLPGMNGADVLNSLKRINPESPVILFSIYSDDDSKINSKIKGKADGLISKPIDHKQLHTAIQKALKKNKQN